MGVGDKFRCYLASCLKPRDGHEYIDQNLDSPFFQTVHVKAHQLCGFKRQLSNLMSKMLALHSATWASKFCRHRGFGFNPSFRGSSPTPVWVPVLNGPGGGPLVEHRILQLTCSTESCTALPKRPKPRFRVEPKGRQHLDL